MFSLSSGFEHFDTISSNKLSMAVTCFIPHLLSYSCCILSVVADVLRQTLWFFDLLFTWSECKFVYSIIHLHFHSREDWRFSNKDIVIELFIIHQRFYRVEEETLILNLIYEIE